MLKEIQAIIHPRCHVSLRFRFCNCFTFTLLSVSVHHCLLIVKCFVLFTWPSLTKKKKKQTVQNKTPVVKPQLCSLLTNSTDCSPRLTTKGGSSRSLFHVPERQCKAGREAGEMERDGDLRALAYFTTAHLSRQLQSVVNLLILVFLRKYSWKYWWPMMK